MLRTLARLIDDEMRAADLTITPDARAALVPLLGGDRLASRSEISKLALYARGKQVVELDDVMAVVSDASDLALDTLIDAVFAGRIPDVEFQFAKARTAGTSPGTILSAHRATSRCCTRRASRWTTAPRPKKPSNAATCISAARSRSSAALKTWSAARLERVMAQLAEATLETRKQPDLAEAITQRMLLSLAVNARRRE